MIVAFPFHTHLLFYVLMYFPRGAVGWFVIGGFGSIGHNYFSHDMAHVVKFDTIHLPLT